MRRFRGFLQMGLLCFLISKISFTQSSGWFHQNSGTTEYLFSCDFNGTHLGLVVGSNGIVLRTADGGDNWSIRESNTIEWLYSVDMVSSVVAWAVGTNGKILKTTNSGLSWLEQISNITEHLLSVFAIDENVVWVGGTGGVLLNSTNGGTDWQQIDLQVPSYFVFRNIQFINSEIGWTNGLRRTLDGGNSWEIISVRSTDVIEFVDQNIGWIISQGPTFNTAVLKTTDGGFNWETQLSSAGTTYRALSFIDEYNGWTVGESGTIMHTTNGGDIWLTQESGTNEILESVFFVDDIIGWAVGWNGTILKTVTGGVTFVGTEETNPSNFYLDQNYPNPFNPTTKIYYQIPELSFVTLKVYDVLGSEIATLVNEEKPAGTYEISWNGSNYPSGIYFYKIETDGFNETKKMVLIK
jgi:photosystem II stability/assembly factor-like uncharacterized protein